MKRHLWTLDDDVSFLNHGSFGACPREVLQVQRAFQDQMEAEPVRFFVRELEPMVAEVRRKVAAFVGADPDDLVFVRNATEGVNGVLRSLPFEAGDEILLTDHGYNAVANCVRWLADRVGVVPKVVTIPFPLSSPAQVTDAILAGVSERTRLAFVDHVTSPTGIVLPVKEIVAALKARGVETLVDGAHGPGMVDLDLRDLGAAYYTGNFHKWICAPKGVAMLHARPDRQEGLVPAVLSHGYNSPRERSRFLETFDWTGTADPSALLSVPAALAFVEREFGGWGTLRTRNRALLRRGRDLLCETLGCEAPVPDAMLGFLAALPIPDGVDTPPQSALYLDALQLALYETHRVEVPIVPWPAPPKRLIRISAMAYNEDADYDALARALREELSIR
ncbi:MAG: aminotransferase class V-fold PLP-dependent enzyme [Myxococcota bacterium]